MPIKLDQILPLAEQPIDPFLKVLKIADRFDAAIVGNDLCVLHLVLAFGINDSDVGTGRDARIR